jgi:GLPGLI family protein
MKKPILLISAIFLINICCFSQESGIVSYTVTTDWTKMMATCDYLSKAEKERSAYAWGGRTYDRQAELKFNETQYRFELKDDREGETYQWRKNDYIIYRDRENQETIDIITLLEKDYVLKDSIYCQNWKIKNDMKEVAGRICMNASCYDSIKGKEVIAWFALDLPISLGPDKYCGLPGLILEINEANGAVVYTATNILLPEEKVEIEKPEVKKKTKVITYEGYNKIVSDYIKQCKKMQRPYFWGLSF